MFAWVRCCLVGVGSARFATMHGLNQTQCRSLVDLSEVGGSSTRESELTIGSHLRTERENRHSQCWYMSMSKVSKSCTLYHFSQLIMRPSSLHCSFLSCRLTTRAFSRPNWRYNYNTVHSPTASTDGPNQTSIGDTSRKCGDLYWRPLPSEACSWFSPEGCRGAGSRTKHFKLSHCAEEEEQGRSHCRQRRGNLPRTLLDRKVGRFTPQRCLFCRAQALLITYGCTLMPRVLRGDSFLLS